MPNRSCSCMVCGRSKVPLVYVVAGRVWLPSGWPWVEGARPRRRSPGNEAAVSVWPIGRRTQARCLLSAECSRVWEARRERQRQRERLPEDAMLRELRPGVGGECRWCGEPVYRRDPAGYVRVDRRSWWHRGRVVHPDAEPEPDCLGEYLAQAFTFREQVRRRDRGLCAACGRDCERVGWDADHVVALEDGGEHLLANAQTLCKPCHAAKTGRENSARAARRRGDLPDRQIALGDSV
jgi:hypothetical protein